MSEIHPRARLGTDFQYGLNVVINDDVRIGASVWIGHGVIFARGTRIANFVNVGHYTVTSGLCAIGDSVEIGAACYIGFGVIINDNCEIGSHVIIDDRVNIGYGSKILSGTHVTEDIKGNPPETYIPIQFDVFDRKRFLERQVDNAEIIEQRSRVGQTSSEMVQKL